MRKKLLKQSFTDISQNRCSYKLGKFDRKISASESLFNKVACLKTCSFIKKRHKCFTVKFAKFLRTPFLQKTLTTFEIKHLLQLPFYYILEQESRLE